jgi:hypothetical protein
MKTSYYNRTRDEIVFDDDGNGSVLMHGGKWMRFGFKENPDEITMVDPSGGPYIALGSDLGYFFEDGLKRIVTAIHFLNDENNPAKLDSTPKPTDLEDPIPVLLLVEYKEDKKKKR